MKKLLIPLLILALLLAACAPAQSPAPMSATGPNTVAGKLSFTLADFYRADSVAPPIPTGDYTVYDAPQGQTLLVAVMDVENLAAFGYSADALMALTLTAGETTCAPTCLMLTGGGTALEPGSVKGKSQARLYYLFAVAPQTGEVTLTATVGTQPFTALLTPADGPKTARAALGDTLSAGGLSIKLERLAAQQKLMPTAPAPLHTFFDAGEGKTHLVLTATVTNRTAEPVPCTQLAGVRINGTVCTPILESADGTDLSDSASIDPGQTHTVHFAAVFDAAQADETASITLTTPTGQWIIDN